MSGKADGTAGEREWMLLDLDAKMARRQGMPVRVPLPRAEFEGLADKGLGAEQLRAWIKEFLTESPAGKDGNWRRRNSELVSALEGFVDKAPLWEAAQEAFAANDYEKALKTLKRITTMCPDDHAAKMNYASALASRGEADKALKIYKEIRVTFAGEADFHMNLAQLHTARGDSDQAIEELLSVLESKPDHKGAMDALAQLGVLTSIYENPRDPASLTFVRTDALEAYVAELWGAAPRDVTYYLEQMVYHETERRFALALGAAERALGVSSGPCERAEVGRVTALRELGRLDEALAAARAFAERAPAAVGAHVEVAQCLRKAGKDDEARAAIERALACDPGDQMAIALGLWPEDREDLRKVQEALPGIEKHAQAHPGAAGAWRSLARAKLVVGNDDEAIALFEKAAGLAPDDEDLRSEWWAELARRQGYDAIVRDAERVGDMHKRDWRLRWNEAEAYRGLGRLMEARACYMQLNADEALNVTIRRKAKRAAMELAGAGGEGPAPTAR
jgi:tetratricopeptide (TPR) repeat protein